MHTRTISSPLSAPESHTPVSTDWTRPPSSLVAQTLPGETGMTVRLPRLRGQGTAISGSSPGRLTGDSKWCLVGHRVGLRGGQTLAGTVRLLLTEESEGAEGSPGLRAACRCGGSTWRGSPGPVTAWRPHGAARGARPLPAPICTAPSPGAVTHRQLNTASQGAVRSEG